MIWLVLLVFIFILFLFFSSFKPIEPSALFSESRPYLSKNPLTKTEIIFYHHLVQALPNHVVLAQVQLSSFIKVDDSKVDSRAFYRWFNPIAQQSVDYLICNKEFNIIAAVELDDKSHSKMSAINRDNKKTNNLAAAKVPLIRWHAEAMPDIAIIQQEFLKYTNPNYDAAISPEWALDDQPLYFKYSKQKKTFSAITLIFGCLVAVFILWTISGTSQRISDLAEKQITKIPHTTNIIKQTNTDLNNRLNKQQADLIAKEKAKKEELLIQRQISQLQEQEKISKIEEAVSKQEAWNNYYKNQGDCSSQDDIVKCGNEYIKQRKNFEKFWEAKNSN